MRKVVFLAILALTSAMAFAQQARPKVAVVLSGGGAKGVAHVRALKVIEEAGIPIDMIVGTSMGSLVGGLYASGYTTAQLDSIVSTMNWMDLLTDKVGRGQRDLAFKQKTENFLIHTTFEKSPFEVLEGGFLKGNSVSYLLSELTADHLAPMDFNKLPIPFACVATDITKNKEVVLHHGILAEALRSSMAIPGVFPPVKTDSMVLVDGGLKNNYPVDVARQMGADYVIGVSVSSEGLQYDELNSTLNVLLQVLDVVCLNKVEENIDQSDVYMHVDVKGYSSASFTSQAVDTLLVHGEQAARHKWDQLIALRDKLAQYGPLPKPVRKPKEIVIDYDHFTPPSTIYNNRRKASFIGIGARFDNEELASLLVGGEYEFNANNHLHVGLNARLGKRIDVNAYVGLSPWKKWNIDLRYRFSYYQTKLRNEAYEAANLEYSKNRLLLEFSRSWKQLRINFGGQFSYVTYHNVFTDQTWDALRDYANDERAVLYFTTLQFDNQDRRLLPTRGMKWHLRYNYITDNGYGFNHGGGVNVVEGYWHMALPLTHTTILSPSVEGRFIQNNNTRISNFNFIGGINTYGHYITQQMSFAGINYYMLAPNTSIIGGLNLRQHITTNNYVFGQANYLIGTSQSISHLFSDKHFFGAAIGYGYKSPIGPVELNLNWSNVTKKLGCFLNIGYMF